MKKKTINKNKLIPCPIESFETKGKEIPDQSSNYLEVHENTLISVCLL